VTYNALKSRPKNNTWIPDRKTDERVSMIQDELQPRSSENGHKRWQRKAGRRELGSMGGVEVGHRECNSPNYTCTTSSDQRFAKEVKRKLLKSVE